jgi:hypothetical protein
MGPIEKTPRSAHVADLGDFQEQFTSVPVDQAIPILEELADHPDPAFRGCALDILERIAPERAEAMAFRFLNDPDGGLRFNALYFLAEQGNRALMPLAARLLASDVDECVRSFAAFCLGMIGDASAIPVLRMAREYDTGTDHEGTPIRETAERSIQIIGDRLSGKGSASYIPSLNFIRVDPDPGGQGP